METKYFGYRFSAVKITVSCLGIWFADIHLWIQQTKHLQCRVCIYFNLHFKDKLDSFKCFILQFLPLCMVSIKEQFMIKSGIWWSAYMISKVKSIHKLIWPKINLNWHNNHRSCNAIYQNKDGLRDFWTKVGNACHSDAAVREFNKTCFLHAHNWMPNSPCRAQLSTHNNWPPLLIHSTKKVALKWFLLLW